MKAGRVERVQRVSHGGRDYVRVTHEGSLTPRWFAAGPSDYYKPLTQAKEAELEILFNRWFPDQVDFNWVGEKP